MTEKIGFNAVRSGVIKALLDGRYQHEARDSIDVKNLLAIGAVSAADVANVIKRCNGTNHSASAHHLDAAITVHVLKSGGWYIKFYFLDPETWFISVHQ